MESCGYNANSYQPNLHAFLVEIELQRIVNMWVSNHSFQKSSHQVEVIVSVVSYHDADDDDDDDDGDDDADADNDDDDDDNDDDHHDDDGSDDAESSVRLFLDPQPIPYLLALNRRTVSPTLRLRSSHRCRYLQRGIGRTHPWDFWWRK